MTHRRIAVPINLPVGPGVPRKIFTYQEFENVLGILSCILGFSQEAFYFRTAKNHPTSGQRPSQGKAFQ